MSELLPDWQHGTLTGLLFQTVDRFAAKPAALRYKAEGRWHDITHREMLQRVTHLALGLRRLGVARGDRVAILSENRPEWAITDYACLCIGVTDVPIYPTLPAAQLTYVLNDSGAVAITVSTASQLAKILAIRSELPHLKHIIAFDRIAATDGVLPLETLYGMGAAADAAGEGRRFREEALAVQPGDVATIIYTSGTTGDPKGVALTHNNIYSNCANAIQQLPVSEADSTLSFLPLSHIFERMAGHYALFAFGVTVNYAESIDTLVQNLGEVQPTIVLAVPRVYEKVYSRALENALSSPIRKRIFFWAKRVGEAMVGFRLAGQRPRPGLGFQARLADKLVFSKLRARVGGRIRFFVSGGAPLSADIARFFWAAGLPIYEGYGLTETSPVICVNLPDRVRLGTVGTVIPNCECAIAADGEIVVRGPNVMVGYFNKPDATREAIDADGWFHTGDIGEFDADGFLRITDRKKDLIVTAGGKKVAPQPIEALIKKNKYVSNAVMLGDKRKTCIVLVVPNFEHLEAWAKRKNILFKDQRELLRNPDVIAKMERNVFRQTAGLASYEAPKKVLLLEHDFTIESGDLTPTLKVKRRVVEKRYQAEIDAAYESSEAALAIS